jgi:hypothetical protein
MTRLGESDSSVGGVHAWHSIIRCPASDLPAIFTEFARVLTPGGPTLLTFRVGTGVLRMTSAIDHDVQCDALAHDPDRIARVLVAEAFAVRATLIRGPIGSESESRAVFLAQRC